MRRPRSFSFARAAQTALADAILALIVITIASAVIYSSVSGVVSTNSEARQKDNLRSTLLQSAGLPLEASYPSVNFRNLSSGQEHRLVNVSGEELIILYMELQAVSRGSANRYDLTEILGAISDLYEWTLPGRSYAVHARGTVWGQETQMLISSQDADGDVAVTSLDDIPHPRLVKLNTVHGISSSIEVNLYLWK